MRTDLLARLKALANGDDRKVTALVEFWGAHGLGDAMLDALIGQMERDHISAKEMGVRYKGAGMSKNPDYDALDRAYDTLNRVKERHGMPASVAVAEALVRVGLDLEAGRAVVKEGRAVYKSATSLKAAAGGQLDPATEAAVVAQQAMVGNDEVRAVQEGLAALDAETYHQIAAQFASASSGGGRATVTSSGDQSVTTKADAWRDWTPGDMAPR